MIIEYNALFDSNKQIWELQAGNILVPEPPPEDITVAPPQPPLPPTTAGDVAIFTDNSQVIDSGVPINSLAQKIGTFVPNNFLTVDNNGKIKDSGVNISPTVLPGGYTL